MPSLHDPNDCVACCVRAWCVVLCVQLRSATHLPSFVRASRYEWLRHLHLDLGVVRTCLCATSFEFVQSSSVVCAHALEVLIGYHHNVRSEGF